MANPVSAFINLVQSMDEVSVSADTQRYSQVVDAILEAAGDQNLLDRYRRALNNAVAWVAEREGEDSLRAAAVQTLLGTAEALQQGISRSQDPDVQALAAMVKGKAHADQVLRTLLHRPLAPKDLLRALTLEPAQLHRVLRWASSSGLVERSGAVRDIVYSITRLGETAIRGTDEPAWVQTAAMLLQLRVEARLLGRPDSRVAHDATQLSGLTAAEAERTFAAFDSALDPSISSALASALGAAHSRADVLLEPDMDPQGRATALVSRALERAGIDDSSVKWWDSPDNVDPRDFRDIALSRSVLCVRNPRHGDLGAEVLAAFGSLIEFERGSLRLRTRSSTPFQSWQRTHEADYGVVARFYSPTAGTSHFIVGGLENHGTVGAARVFYGRIESFLDAKPDRSFAAIVRTDGHSEPEIIGDLQTLFTEDPYAMVRRGETAPVARTFAAVAGEQLTSHAMIAAATGLAAFATTGVISYFLEKDRAGPRRICVRRQRSAPEHGVLDIREYHSPAGEEVYGQDLPLAARERPLRDDVGEPEFSPESTWADHA